MTSSLTKISCFKSFLPFKNAHVTKTSLLAQETVKQSTQENIIFDKFIILLQQKQQEIINTLENLDKKCDAKFSRDEWGSLIQENEIIEAPTSSGGRTRVIQNGTIIEKGAVSITCIKNGILTSERAKSIQEKSIEFNSNTFEIKEGDVYSAAALSLVLHSRSPMVPTFRSDVRLFLVQSKDNPEDVIAYFGGGADLTPYYLYEDDVINFHTMYYDLCKKYDMDYKSMKEYCDAYFYLPARDEHRGTGGIFFDNLLYTENSFEFVEGVMDTWMPSWIPIINERKSEEYTEEERYWQLLRRGRYLEFNLLYDRGVRFGLIGKNPRVEGRSISFKL